MKQDKNRGHVVKERKKEEGKENMFLTVKPQSLTQSLKNRQRRNNPQPEPVVKVTIPQPPKLPSPVKLQQDKVSFPSQGIPRPSSPENFAPSMKFLKKNNLKKPTPVLPLIKTEVTKAAENP